MLSRYLQTEWDQALVEFSYRTPIIRKHEAASIAVSPYARRIPPLLVFGCKIDLCRIRRKGAQSAWTSPLA
jgi:hypothetical protein